MNRLSTKRLKRSKRKMRVRKKISGSAQRPRLSVFKSNKNISVQAIDDAKGTTIASVSTLEKEYSNIKRTLDGGKEIGKAVGQRLLKAGVNQVIFDRNGYLFHGIVKAVAEGARESGLKF